MTLKVTNLSKRYEDRWILRDVAFEAQAGEITGIFGATGAGKSTLIRILSGAEKCNGGSIFNDSVEVTEISCEERGFHLPNLRNDSFWKNLFKTNKKSELSDGEGQILALEDALEKANSVLLLDDTFCFMDRQKRDIYFAELRRVTKKKNLTIVFAGNNFEEILLLCDKVAVLAKTDIQQFDVPRTVYEKPANSEVAHITGRNNLIKARRLTSTKIETPEFLTLDGDHRVFTDKTDKHALGAITQEVFLTIRPEHISIAFGASFPVDNLLKATIKEICFQGSTTIVKLDANGLLLESLVLRLVGINVGEECMVGLPPDRILVLKN
ncbi:ABC transporter ATP-binding protein [soil metagenome]